MKDPNKKASNRNTPEAPVVNTLRNKMKQNVNSAASVKNGEKQTGGKNKPPKNVSGQKLSNKKQIPTTNKKPVKTAHPKRVQPTSRNRKNIITVKSYSENFYASFPFLKKLNSHKYLALDIDIDKIRYILARKSGDLVKVEKWGIQRFPSEISHRFKALQITLENLKEKFYRAGTEIRVSIFSTDFIIKHEIFPYMKKKRELERAILFRFRDEIKHYNDEKYAWGYDVLEQFEDQGVKKVRIQVVFAPLETINRYVYIFEHLKLPVDQLIPRPAALIASYNRFIENPKSDLLINISYDFTQILYLKGGKFEYIRNLGIGARNLEFSIHNDDGKISMDQSEGASGNLTSGQAEGSILRKRLLEKLKDLKTKQNPVLHTFFAEILRSIAFIQGNDRQNFIDRILLTGYGIQKESLVPYLKARLNIPLFVIFPRLADRPLSEQVKFGEFFTTIGTLLQKYKGFNLIPKKFKERTFYRKLGHWLYFIIFLTTLIAGYMSFVQFQLYSKQEALVKEKEKEYITLNPYEQSYKQLLQLIGNLKEQNESLKNQVETQPPLLEMMRLLSNITPKKIRLDDFVFSKLESGGKIANKEVIKKLPKYAVTIEGEVEGDFVSGDVTLINYINSLYNLKFFKEINVDHKERDQEKKVITFGITLKF